MLPDMTHHARERWLERFSCLDYSKEWRTARRPGKRTRVKIRKQCPEHKNVMVRNNWDLIYLLSESNVVFVYDTRGLIVTVFPYNNGVKQK